MGKRRAHNPEFKAKVAMKGISGCKTFQEIATDHIHPTLVRKWKRKLPDSGSNLFTRGKKSTEKEECQSKETGLFRQNGKLQMELE